MTDADRERPDEQAPADDIPGGCLRALLYAVLLPFVMTVVYELRTSWIAERCSECDMVWPVGMGWAIATLLVLLVAIAVGESLYARKRRERSGQPSTTDGPD